VRHRPVRDFVAEQVRRAPWWTISFLVHVIALLIMWQWPGAPTAEVAVEQWREVKLYEAPPKEQVGEFQPPKPPQVKGKLPEEFKIGKELRESGHFDQERLPDEPPPGPPSTEPEEPREAPEDPKLPIFAVVNEFPFPPTGPGGYGKRGDIRRFGDGGDGGGKGKGEPGGPPEVPPIIAGLIWLAKAQEKDGSWNAERWGGSNNYKVGMTGLALLAFQGGGYTHQKGTFHGNVRRGLEWLRRHQRPDGSFPWETFYEQGIAAMAVTEAYGITRDPRLRPMAQRTIDYICKVQPPHGGFRYNGPVAKNEGDMSVTGWQIMAIKSAMLAGLSVPPQAVERSREFLTNAWRDYGASAYLVGRKEAGSLAVTAIGMLCRVFLSEGDELQDEIDQVARYLHSKETRDLRAVRGGTSKELVRDLYYTYYSSLAMFQQGGEYWRAWREMYRDPLIKAQVHRKHDERGRYVRGSWKPNDYRWGNRGGRVYSTAMAILSLEAPYRFLPLNRYRR